VQGLTHPDDPTATVMVRTDDEGRFTIDDATSLEMIRIKAPGYKVVEQPLNDLTPVELALEPFEVRAIYIGLGLLSVPDYTLQLLDLAAESELNAVVLDVKGDRATIAWPSELPLAVEADAYAGDNIVQMSVSDFLAEAKKRGLYTIARMVMFRDNNLAEARPEWSPKWEDGSLYYDYEDLLWDQPLRARGAAVQHRPGHGSGGHGVRRDPDGLSALPLGRQGAAPGVQRGRRGGAQ
jgi:hypothetical protein